MSIYEKKRINIMTSCDDNLALFILPQLVSIDKNLSHYDVYFYLLHSRIQPENISTLVNFAENQTGINLHVIVVKENESFYDSIAQYGGGQWPFEAYYSLRLQDYLPEDIERILYIDAGDVIIDGDIGPYYFDDFEGNSIIATPLIFKKNPVSGENTLFTQDDILAIAGKSNIFNSGSYVINVDKFRKEGYSTDDYLYLCSVLDDNKESGFVPFFGDQGFLSAAFVEDIKFFGYPQNKDASYMPYNFVTSFWKDYTCELAYEPVVIHYAIRAKPWIVRFSDEVIDAVINNPDFIGNHLIAPIPSIACMTPQHLRMGEIWWEYAMETPIYEEADFRARVTADNWIEYYFPMCRNYINTFYLLHQAKKG